MHYPAIDISDSLSRLTNKFLDEKDLRSNSALKNTFEESFNGLLSEKNSVEKKNELKKALCQEQSSSYSLAETKAVFEKVYESLEN